MCNISLAFSFLFFKGNDCYDNKKCNFCLFRICPVTRVYFHCLYIMLDFVINLINIYFISIQPWTTSIKYYNIFFMIYPVTVKVPKFLNLRFFLLIVNPRIFHNQMIKILQNTIFIHFHQSDLRGSEVNNA